MLINQNHIWNIQQKIKLKIRAIRTIVARDPNSDTSSAVDRYDVTPILSIHSTIPFELLLWFDFGTLAGLTRTFLFLINIKTLRLVTVFAKSSTSVRSVFEVLDSISSVYIRIRFDWWSLCQLMVLRGKVATIFAGRCGSDYCGYIEWLIDHSLESRW